jgi:hypothetical protein
VAGTRRWPSAGYVIEIEVWGWSPSRRPHKAFHSPAIAVPANSTPPGAVTMLCDIHGMASWRSSMWVGAQAASAFFTTPIAAWPRLSASSSTSVKPTALKAARMSPWSGKASRGAVDWP